MHESAARLYEAAKEMKGTEGQSAVARLLNESPQTLNNWETRGVSKAGALKAEEVIGCSAGWLLKGAGAMVASQGAAYRLAALPGLPVVGTAKLGDDGLFYELEHPVGHGDGRIDWPSRDPNAYAVRCKGDSMKPRIRAGEFVIVEPNHEVRPGDEVLVKARDGRVMVKELAYLRDGTVYLDSVNEAHPKVSIPLEQIEVLHYVAGIAKAALWHAEEAEPVALPSSQDAEKQYRALVARPVSTRPPLGVNKGRR